jgi:SAM-dependent methyltransferase
MSQKDRDAVRAFYDNLADAEWDRLEITARGRVGYVVHRRFLSPYVASGDLVLEVGAGPGRFTAVLAELGARVAVADISPVQLELNAQHLLGTEAEKALISRELLDICDTSRYEAETFDVVLAYGGPLSYAFEHDRDALSGLFRILKPGGVVVASVMSLLGSWRHFLRGVVEEAGEAGEEANDLILSTGDLRYFPAEHICKMYRASDVERLVGECGGELLAVSASNWASLGDPEALAELESDPVRWANFLEHEIRACREPGALDGGTHILFAARVL